MIEVEKNDSVVTANPISLLTPSAGNVATIGDLDFYKVTIAGAGLLNLTVDVPTNSSLDYYKLWLYSSTGSRLATFATGNDQVFQTPVSAAGDYYVSIGSGTYYGYNSLAANQYNLTVSNTLGIASGYESEFNNTVATGNALPLATSVIGQIATNGDLDFYKVTITGAGLLSLTIDVPTDSSLNYYKLGLYSSTGNLLATLAAGKDQVFQTPVSAAGDYYVSIGPGTYYGYDSKASNQYNLTVGNALGTASGYESEFNNTIVTGNTLALATSVIGQIATNGDVDFYKVKMSGAGLLSLTIDVPTDSSLDYYKLGLYSSTGNLLATLATGKDQVFQTPVSAAGDYYVSVGPGTYYSNDSDAVNQYNLTVDNTLGNASGYESEFNNTVVTANALALATPVIGQIATSGDLDFYKVSVIGSGLLILTIDVPTGSSLDHYKLGLYSSTGSLLATFATGEDQTFQAQVPSAGDYYISIGPGTYYSSDRADVNQYNLTVDNLLDSNAAGLVTIGGTATQGQTLTATASDTDGLGVISYQWKAAGVNIGGATNGTFALTEAQVGKLITVTANYTDGRGKAESVTSNATTAVVNVNDAGSVTIGGIATQGQTLTATASDTDGLGTISYQWEAAGVNISGATNGTFALTEAQVGKPITVTASYTDGHGKAESVTGDATTAVANVNDAGSVIIGGTATQGQTLTATASDADGLGVISYQWKAASVNISGATNGTFALTEAQVGKPITVTANYTDGHGKAESVTSNATTAIANVNDAGSVTIGGTATQGQILAATASDADGLGAIHYQWKAAGVNISGATSSTFNLTEAQVGKSITVTASYTDGHGKAEFVTSDATAAIANVSGAPAITFTQNIEGGKLLMKLYSSDISNTTNSISMNFSYTSSLSFSEILFAGSSSVSSSSSQIDNLGSVQLTGQFVTNSGIGQPFATLEFVGNGSGTFDLNFSALTINGGAAAYIDPSVTTYSIVRSADTSQIVLDEDSSFAGSYDPFHSIFGSTLQVAEQAEHGTVSIVSGMFGSKWNYAPAANYYGADTFSVRAIDGLQEKTLDVSVSVAPVSDAPTGTGYLTGVSTYVDESQLLDEAIFSDVSRFAGNDNIKIDLPEHLNADVVMASGGGDDRISLKGGGGRLNVNAGSGNDQISVLNDAHAIDGGAGIDTITLTGMRSGYSVQHSSLGYTVTDSAGAGSTLVNVERIIFSDTNVALDIDGSGGQAYRLYQAAFNRTPDLEGLGFHMGRMDTAGASLSQVAQNFIDSPEFAQTYGNLNNREFVTQLYANVLHRAPDEGGLKYHTELLDAGTITRAMDLVGFSESPENQDALITIIGDGFAYVPYTA